MSTELMKQQVGSRPIGLEVNRVLRNTYALLAMTLMFSAVMAGVSMAFNMPHPGLVLTLVGYFGLLFATSHYRNSSIVRDGRGCARSSPIGLLPNRAGIGKPSSRAPMPALARCCRGLRSRNTVTMWLAMSSST